MEEYVNVTTAEIQTSVEIQEADIELDLVHQFFQNVNGLIGPIICFIGILGNAFNIIVFSRMIKTRKSAITSFLLAIAVADLCVVIIYLLYGVLCLATPPKPLLELYDFTEDQAGTFVYVFYYLWHYPTNIFVTMSAWLTVAMMVFRFIAVYHPLKASTWCSPRRARYVMLVLAVISIVIYIPSWFAIEIYPLPKHGIFLFFDSKLGKNKYFHYIYLVAIIETVNSFLPFTICVILSGLLIRTLRMSNQILSDPSVSRSPIRKKRVKNQRKISLMLVVVVTVFLICTMPSFLCRGVKYKMRAYMEDSWKILRGVADIFLIINHSSNFVIYALTNDRYLKRFYEMVFCRPSEKLGFQTSIILNRNGSKLSVKRVNDYKHSSKLSFQYQKDAGSSRVTLPKHGKNETCGSSNEGIDDTCLTSVNSSGSQSDNINTDNAMMQCETRC